MFCYVLLFFYFFPSIRATGSTLQLSGSFHFLRCSRVPKGLKKHPRLRGTKIRLCSPNSLNMFPIVLVFGQNYIDHHYVFVICLLYIAMSLLRLAMFCLWLCYAFVISYVVLSCF